MNPIRQLFATSIILCSPVALFGQSEMSTDFEKAQLKPMQGQVVRYLSKLFGDRQPMAICTTDTSDRRKPLIVDLSPGTLTRLERAASRCEQMCRYASELGEECVAIMPCGRGAGTVYQGYGDYDVYEAVAAVQNVLAIDPDRLYVTGASMGGASTFFHASHHPDFWAAAAPFCGYCDYKLWEKPGGTTFHRQPWEEHSWIARGAAYRPEIFRHLPIHMTHGAWDRAVGGGVPTEHSRQMARKLEALNYPHVYVEVPKMGHSCRTPETWKAAIDWLLQQNRTKNPDRVSLVVHTLRHNRAYWVAVEQQHQSDHRATVEATLDRSMRTLEVQTTNVRRIALGPVAETEPVALDLDGTSFAAVNLSAQPRFESSSNGVWSQLPAEIADDQKKPGVSGPFGDLFYGPTVIVYGTAGSDAETNFNQLMARGMPRFYRRYNGGVHRGGITGDNEFEFPTISDEEALTLLGSGTPMTSQEITVDKDLLERANFFLIGNRGSNRLLATLSEGIPLDVGEASLTLAGKQYKGERVACLAILPHPDGNRYVAVLAGCQPDAITWASHLNLQLLPDYFVFDGGKTLEWGFFDNHWRSRN